MLERYVRNNTGVKQDAYLTSNASAVNNKPELVIFHQFELAVVDDCILDANHPALAGLTILAEKYPNSLNGAAPTDGDKDFSLIGCVKFRRLTTDEGRTNDELNWAFPIERTGITEYPLLNEVVSVVQYSDGNYYYTRRVNINGFINAAADFQLEIGKGDGERGPLTYDGSTEITGPISSLNITQAGQGVLGTYFKFNPNIRALLRHEGDTIVESRFGSSVRFGSYVGTDVDKQDAGYKSYPAGSGHPAVLIRNRQADPDPSKPEINSPKGYVTESINNDGSSIHMTSGKTESDFKTTCKKVMLQSDVPEEQPKFSPSGLTSFTYPKLDGDQIVINSDRLVFQARANEFFQYSKKRMSLVTDDEFTLDAQTQIVLTTNGPATINAPAIFLGEANQANEPVLLGTTTTDWLQALCEWNANQCDWLIDLCNDWLAKHEHLTKKDPTLAPKPEWVSKLNGFVSAMRTMKDQVKNLQNIAPKNKSQRVFVVGGGTAPGQAGGDLKK